MLLQKIDIIFNNLENGWRLIIDTNIVTRIIKLDQVLQPKVLNDIYIQTKDRRNKFLNC